MKTKLLLTACAAALVLGAPAYAAPNTSTVTQSGASNSASVTQNSTSATTGSKSTITQSGTNAPASPTKAIVIQGDNDESEISQSAGATDLAQITQDGLVGGFSKVTQTGGGNSAIVGQSDDGQGGTGLASKVTSSTITQTGSGEATVTQTYSIVPADTFAPQTTSLIEQDGANNATVIQLDLGQQSIIRQKNNGGDNSAFVTQGDGVLSLGGATVDGNSSMVDQLASSNGFVDVRQTYASDSRVVQTGDKSDALVTQLGNATAGNISSVTQADLGLASVQQLGGGNQSTITQNSGIFVLNADSFPITAETDQLGIKDYASVADVLQSGDFNEVSVGQTGNSNFAVVTQNGVSQASAVLTNFADITQSGDLTSLEATQNASGNSLTARQGGTASVATITQNATATPFDVNNVILDQGLNGGIGALAQIDQTGGFNFANVVQTGDYSGNEPGPFARRANAVYIDQTQANREDGNQLVVDQSGTDNLFEVFQAGGGFIAGVTQSGTRNLFSLDQAAADAGTLLIVNASTQSGTDGTIQGTQSGGNSDLTFTQSGLGNIIFFDQAGTGNSATFTQGGTGNIINVTAQTGDGNTSTFTQAGSANGITLEQVGNRNTSTIAQNALSSGNSADVHQLANDGISTVTQSDTGNSAIVFQHSDFANSTVIQSGTGNTATVTQGTPVLQ